jgi:aminoglycoside phosphotransferase (APT) family kinase protein
MNVDSVIDGSRGIEGIRWLLLGRESRRAVAAAIAGMLAPGWQVDSLELRRTKVKPGRKLSAWYEAELRELASDSRRSHGVAATWTPHEPDVDHDRVGELHDDAVRRGVAPSFGTLRSWVPAWRLQILVSPLDPRFPGLVRLSAPGALAELADGPEQVTTVRYRPGQRHVLRHGEGDAAQFVKLSTAHDVDGLVALTGALGRWLEADGGRLHIVSPLRTLRKEEAVVYPSVPGRPVPADPRSLPLVGAALRRLHEAPVEPAAPPDGGLREEAAAVVRAAEHIDALSPVVATFFHSVLAEAVEVGSDLPGEPPALIHGDFKLDHVWHHDGGLTLIDMDRCRQADPALDIGKLLADMLWRWSVGATAADRRDLERAFLTGYFGCNIHSNRLARARVYQALFVLKAAARRMPVTDPGFVIRTAALVRVAGRIAAGARSQRARRWEGVSV